MATNLLTRFSGSRGETAFSQQIFSEPSDYLHALRNAKRQDEWPECYAHGYRQLSQDERAAMKNFAFLWSYFEATCLNENASAPAIAAFCTDMKARKRLRIADYQAAIEYFSKRYFDGANTTPQFDGLNLPNTRQRAMVLKAISGQKVSNDDLLAGLLVIIYRLRNNLMHGEKWAYGIKGQLSNFDHANNVLMAVKLANL